MRRVAALLGALALVAALASCGDDDDETPNASSSTTSTSAAGPSSSTTTGGVSGDVRLELTEVASLERPLALVARPGTGDLYVAEKTGRVQHLTSGGRHETVVDLSDDVSDGNEQGLLGIAFSPDGSRLYVSYTNRDGDTRLEEVDPSSGARTEIFALAQPYANHNGGNILFGPDGKLWFGLGDGGAGGDPENRAQNPDELLGKILRFDPATWKPEIYALGARNPWRFSFDRATDDLWIGDVGQNAWEEIDHVPAGTPARINLGWPQSEGTHGYKSLHPEEGTIQPVYEYGHDQGQSVVGGFVYRGTAIPTLVGTYVFADTYTGVLWSLRPGDDGSYAFVDLGIEVPGALVSSFGEDADGELYVMSLEGGVYRIEGT